MEKRYRSFNFTHFIENTDDVTKIKNHLEKIKAKYTFQEEITKTGKKHIQGFYKLNNNSTISAQATKLEKVLGKRPHLEFARSDKHSEAYCRKEDSRYGDTYTNIFIKKPIIDNMIGKKLYSWQQEILNIINGPIDDRKIYWIYDPVGNTGKTTFVKHILLTYPNKAELVGASAKDMHFCISNFLLEENNDLEIVLIDVKRSTKNNISYQGLEGIKDGLLFSAKYESKKAIFNSPHVFVFCNELPKTDQFSDDRLHIIYASGGSPRATDVESKQSQAIVGASPQTPVLGKRKDREIQ